MPKFRVSYKKEYEDKVENFSVEMEARKPWDAKREIKHKCKREAYELMEHLLEEKGKELGCGNYGKDDIGIWTTKGSSNPSSFMPRKGKWILHFYDFAVEEME